jgi:hypothetical protein
MTYFKGLLPLHQTEKISSILHVSFPFLIKNNLKFTVSSTMVFFYLVPSLHWSNSACVFLYDPTWPVPFLRSYSSTHKFQLGMGWLAWWVYQSNPDTEIPHNLGAPLRIKKPRTTTTLPIMLYIYLELFPRPHSEGHQFNYQVCSNIIWCLKASTSN